MKALIIYREVAFAIKANATLRGLRHCPDAKTECEVFEVLPWRMDMLKFRAGATAALIEAIDAHLILFAGGFPESLPYWLLDWLEKWAGVRRIKDAALATTAGTSGDTPSTITKSALRQFARKHGLHFIIAANVVHEDKSQFYEDDTNDMKLRPGSQSPPIYTPHLESHQCWGINE
jgi:hypothetical protein